MNNSSTIITEQDKINAQIAYILTHRVVYDPATGHVYVLPN